MPAMWQSRRSLLIRSTREDDNGRARGPCSASGAAFTQCPATAGFWEWPAPSETRNLRVILHQPDYAEDREGERARLDALRRFAKIQQRAQMARDIGRLADAAEQIAQALAEKGAA